ncbi:uncharacterized protein STEHIDRAFT_173170 [Stereum hirsutum FP-91666 SS1]|uniref:Uncharacterized protein n=1 Tax=Stereum hirsutum (strain FP-91666) TaxID=721885 RepID=R7RVT0_STEHR|nr:uncharacterized protein STEHIDRAFT_173170 [Stereum hirsutum FP-91666 SS1]EIM79301.1 hypothetical protein STEHIDRAFT_173170 [Stereum hirsutum FP-91666 SS1]
MSTYAGSSSAHARGDIVSQNDQLSPHGSISLKSPPRSLVESLSSADRDKPNTHGASSQIETYSQEQASSRATNASGSASPGIGSLSQDQQQDQNPSRSTPPTRTSFDEMYLQTHRLSVTGGDLNVDRADEDGNGTTCTNDGADAYFQQENGPLSSVKSFDTGRNNQINDDHQNGTIRSAPSSTPITPLQSRLSIPSSVGRHGVGSRQSTPPPTTNHILHPFDRTRGRHETSNTRAAGSTPMTSTKYAAGNSGRERHRDDDATRAMSSVESYNRIFERLGTVAFFGDSPFLSPSIIAWASVFGAQRGNVLSLAWSASLFMSASVIAGSASLITYSD